MSCVLIDVAAAELMNFDSDALHANPDGFTCELSGRGAAGVWTVVGDETFATAGKVGLWTKADSYAQFDNFEVRNIREGSICDGSASVGYRLASTFG